MTVSAVRGSRGDKELGEGTDLHLFVFIFEFYTQYYSYLRSIIITSH